MSRITKISIQKRRKDLVNIFLDGKYVFSAKLEDIFLKKIKTGQDLSPADVQKLKKSKLDKNILDSAIRYISSRPHSEKEIVNYLKRKNQSSTETKKIISKLKSMSLINDIDFTKWLVALRQKSGKGSRMIKFELVQKGVSKEIISEAFASTVSDESIVFQALDKKLKKMRMNNVDEAEIQTRNKILRYLVSKGFDYETSSKAIDLRLKKV